MDQCRRCLRFATPESTACGHCDSTELGPVAIDSGEDFSNYAIHLREIELDGKAYAIERLINRGGCSTIVQLSSTQGQHYALKVPFVFDNLFTSNTGNSDSELRSSLRYIQSEIANLRRLPRGHFLQVLAMGTAAAGAGDRRASFPFILMELANTTVKHLIDAEQRGALRIPFGEKKRLILDFVDSLKSLHAAQVVHRDLSPDNIFSVNRGGRIRYIVSDFGTSKHRQDIGSTMSSQILSHDFYLDPERITNRRFRYDERSDIWSAGAIISEVIAGNFWVNIIQSLLFTDAKTLDFIGDILEPMIKNKVDPEIYRILCRCLHRDPARRYARIGQLQEDLASYFARASREEQPRITIPSVMFLNVFLHLSLPLAFPGGDAVREIPFEGVANLELDHLGSACLLFPGFLIESATLCGTRLFSLEVEKNRLKIHFRRGYFLKRYRRHLKMLGQAQGELKVHFQIGLNYFRY